MMSSQIFLHRTLPVLIAAIGVFECLMAYELVQDGRYLRQEIRSGDKVEVARGRIRKVKWHAAGKAKPRIAVSVKGYSRWLYLNSGTQEEFDTLQAGTTIEAGVYRLRPDAWLKRSFLRDHGFITLDVAVDGRVLRDEASIDQQISNNGLGIAVAIAAVLVTFLGAWVTWMGLPTRSRAGMQRTEANSTMAATLP